MKKLMQRTTAKNWIDAGVTRTHKLVVIVEFNGCDYSTVEIVSESDRPSWATPLTTCGAVSEQFINNAVMLARLGFDPINAQ